MGKKNSKKENDFSTPSQKKAAILTWIAVDFSEDAPFLQKLNRMTFGLLKKDNIAVSERWIRHKGVEVTQETPEMPKTSATEEIPEAEEAPDTPDTYAGDARGGRDSRQSQPIFETVETELY